MIVEMFLASSIALQCLASYFAIRIAYRSGWRTAWLLIAGAIVLLAVRNGVLLMGISAESLPDPSDVVSEWLAMIISILLVAGLAPMGRRGGSTIDAGRQAEPAPRDSDRHGNALFDQSAVGVAQLDSRTGRFVRVNRFYSDMVGYTCDELLQKDFQSITHPDDLQADLDNMARLRAGELGTFQMEKRYIRKDGAVIWARLTVLPLWTKPAEPDFHLAVVEDITDRKRAEDRLRTSEWLLTEAQRVAHIGNWNWEISSNTITWSDEMYRMFGLTPQQGPITYETFLSRIHPEDRDEVNRVTHAALQDCRPFDHDRRVVWPDGTVRVYHSRGAVEVDAGGKPARMYGTAQDVTDRKRAEGALRESEARYRNVVELSPEAIYINQNGRIVFANSACVTLLGADTVEQLIGQSPFDYLHPDHHQEVRELIRGLLEQGGQMPLTERRWVRMDGSTVHVEETASVLPFAGGAAIQVFARDITARIRIEERLKFMQFSVTRASDAVFWLTSDARIVDVNDSACRILGYTKDELLAMTVFDIDPDFTRQDWPAAWNELKRLGSLTLETRHRARSGRIFPVEINANYLEYGGSEYNCAFARDITDRKRAEEAAREAGRLNQQIIANAREGIIVYTREGRYAVWNPYMEELTGLKADRVLGKRPTDLPALYEVEHARLVMEPETMERIEAAVARAMAGEIVPSLEVPIVFRRSGETGWTSVRYGPFRDAEGRIIGVLATVWEMTERKRTEAALREHAERMQMLSRQLVEAQEAEGRRIGRELHDELGQILTSLKIYLQTLPERSDPASFGKLQADSLALIDQALDRVRNLSSDLRPTVLDDLGLAAALRWMLDRRAREAGFTTQCVARGMDERLPPEIESTAFRIAQEALTNVIKHANARSVRVELSRRKNVMTLLIVDDGIGFDPEAARAEALRGKSLGLVGMEERASLVNGRIALRTAPGKGTELMLEIPLPEAGLPPSGRERSRSS
ncbi:MAG TPA: PAS domain S-box protein [Nitrospiria bacterium]|nr:PAS domain S-box protein [Nitrospiria bacterium]